ncbi:hypothetical protein LC612_35840 [Nostoc sp. CHAB 5834]|nr:hypothetical protein [Nostoc sp. CHAB 5834]
MPDTRLAPVVVNGFAQFLPIEEQILPSFLIVVKRENLHKLSTPWTDEDRCIISAVSVHEALGRVFEANPALSYDDILDHMEI